MSPSRYTRLKAIKEFGYDVNWKDLRKFHVGIVGVGGLGSASSEMAVRCGIGKVTLFDYDTVEIVNLNRHMFKEKHVGQPKVEVAAKILKGHKIAPKVRCILIPGTPNIYLDALKEGLIEIFLNAGVIVSTPTCGPCLGGFM